jgi:transcriptional regulator with GAF, ATPase, and Fis domain
LGETKSRSIDVRVVAATHRDLRALSQEGDFRLDLYFRLAVATVELPPLRERSGDVLILAREFLGRVAPQLSWSAEAVELLCAHPWPGNVRELRHVVEVAAATCLELGSISVEACHLELHGTSRPAKESAASIAASRGGYQQRVEDFKRALVRDALEQHDGNQAAAARSLGMRRQSLWHLARKFDLV